ncbi:Mlo-like protein [Thalictrum thalictroides]|uniref:MLO-like protein n=1 Tax=Thalictrum thalictroides TaxID=46969 RepID=A0A7J6XCB1_THATH|nr:Mlo-like protein [Thalictrum thalictroides]
MAEESKGRSLEETPTWAVAVVCFVLVVISIFIEHIIHLIGKWFTKKHKRALYEALEKVKAELMLMGFISLLLTVLQGPIADICIPQSVANTWHPCNKKQEQEKYGGSSDDSTANRRLLSDGSNRRILASKYPDYCKKKGKVALVSTDGIHQLHIFIFVLAVTHVLYCIITLALGRLKMRKWKAWEKETKTVEYQFQHDPERFRFARDTSFGRRHLNFWSETPILIWIVCFFRQFFRSVPKVDYLTLRHGFIMAHLAPQSASRFDFQKYINRSLEEDFKVVVGISPTLWFFAVLFLLFNTHGWFSYLWLPFLPLIIILLVGTKLQVVITRMGLRIQDRGDVVKGVPTVKPADDLFWFNSPGLILFLINFVLFQNAFQLAFFAWSWYEFGLRSCFHEKWEDVIIRISMGVIIQLLCSYVTLPLYALVTQMGTTMKPTIFNDRVASALKNWHHTARKQIKHNRASGSVTPMSSRPATPSYGMSPVHLLRNNVYRSDQFDSLQNSPRRSNMDYENYESEGSRSPSPMHQHGEGSSSHHYEPRVIDEQEKRATEMNMTDLVPNPPAIRTQHEIDIDNSNDRQHPPVSKVGSNDFSFDKR